MASDCWCAALSNSHNTTPTALNSQPWVPAHHTIYPKQRRLYTSKLWYNLNEISRASFALYRGRLALHRAKLTLYRDKFALEVIEGVFKRR
ncbi:hypothetical protein HQ41_08480 [Porphyromonas sp. COT-290 OH860]|nr:hypothetical protein HQ41_08480 [Porphyromonas sp. COT-290 OH860]